MLEMVMKIYSYFKLLNMLFYRVVILHFYKNVFETLQICKVIVFSHIKIN
jgi:hypothetical protein